MESRERETKNRIRLLLTSDVHGKVFPHSYADGSKKNFGFGRISSAIKELRDENTILIDNGDVLEGSPLQLYHMMTELRDREPSPVSRVMAAMNYDYINLGNHDYNFGPDVLFRHIETTGAKLITSNMSYKGNPVCNYELIEIAGKKIALFGLITHFVTEWESDEHLKGIEFFDAFETAKSIVSKIKSDGGADYIVCVYHGGFERDPETGEPIGMDTGENQGYRMLREIPEIDIFLTGHQHLFFSHSDDETAYIQPGPGGEYIACVDIYTGEEGDEEGEDANRDSIEAGREKKKGIEAQLIKIETEADEAILDLVRDEEADCQVWLDQVIGRTNLDLRVHDEFDARLNKAQLITFINKVQLKRSNADISAVALFGGATGIGPDITIRQLVSTYIFPDNIVVKRINGRILKEYLEKDVEYWAVLHDDVEGDTIIVNPDYMSPLAKHFNYDLLDGVEYTAKISNPVGERIISLTRNGVPIEDNQEFTIAINHYRAAGGGEFFMLSNAETVWEDSVTMIDILVNEIKENGIIDFEPVNNVRIEV